MMLLAVLAGFIAAGLAPALVRVAGRHSGLALAILPASLFIGFLLQLPAVADAPVRQAIDWIPSLGIQLSFWLDGLSLLMALLITGIGTLIFIYAGSYLQGHRDLGRFLATLLCFMAAMLGLVLADNLVSLFVFWELTSITSFLLIGFNHQNAHARRCATQGLYVTVGGGLVMMAGFIVLAVMGDSYELSELMTTPGLADHGSYALALGLILCGAFTKSAQFPFHFWLPNAMAAPTPVSAYLHSATMVKAGVYLLARLQPGLGGTELWTVLLTTAGGITLLLGIFMAARRTGIKPVLAYSTIMALGTLTLLIGIGTPLAMTAAMTFLLAHSLYKGALFMVAGIIDHEAGSKDFLTVEGLRHVMPITAAVAGLAALSLAGVAPLFGFIGKELLFEASLEAAPWLALVAWLGAVLVVAVACLVGIRPWFGHIATSPKPAHEAPWPLLLGPALLASLGLVFGLLPGLVDGGLISAAATAVTGQPQSVSLSLWHGVNLPLLLSLASLALGITLYWRLDDFRRLTRWCDRVETVGPEAGFDRFIAGLVSFSKWQTSQLQNGYLRFYLIIILLTMLVSVGAVFVLRDLMPALQPITNLRLYEAVILAILTLSVSVAVFSRSRLASVASLGALGFSVALLYVLFSAPDVSITQILVETLTVILLVLVLYRLPPYLSLSPTRIRLRDALIAGLSGLTITLLILSTVNTRFSDSISGWFIEGSVPLGEGRNIVNVILVDFRAFDTLGELFVLTLAAIGVYAMIKFRSEDRKA